MTLALDGSVHGNHGSGTSLGVNLTTSNTNDIIVVAVTQNAAQNPGISDTAGLTWTHRAGTSLSGSFIDVYVAVASGTLSADTITVTAAASTFMTIDAFGISGANTTTKFDNNASIPATSATDQVTISTSNANDFLICACALGQNTSSSPPAGFTTIGNINFQYVGYQIVSATQSNLTETVGSGGATIGDAIIQSAGGGFTAKSRRSLSARVGSRMAA